MNSLRRASYLLLIVVLVSFGTVRAQDIFEKEQVDQQAIPLGGQLALLDFIRHNIRVPFVNKVENISGKVEINGVIELDGSMSSLQVVSGLNPASDHEVLRIFRLFRAWEPARKGGAPVRQYFNYALQFGSDPVVGYNKMTREFDFYFDKAFERIGADEGAEYHVKVGVDENGFPGNSFSFRTKKKKRWSEPEVIENEPAPLSRRTTAYLLGVEEVDLDGYLGGSEAFILKVGTEPLVTGLPEYIVTKDTRPVREQLRGLYSKVYYASGQTASVRNFQGGAIVLNLEWYPNSKLKAKYYTETLSDGTEVDKILSLFDSTGRALTVNGNGELSETGFKWGKGIVKDGYLTGLWKAVSPSGDAAFEEEYERGRLIKGRRYADGKVMEYETIEIEPSFAGGMERIYMFLAKNIRYPVDAARSRKQGRVVISFFIETDGGISELKVDQSVDPALDREALRVIGLTSGSWVPGQRRGGPVRARYTMPVNFRLE